jgi:phosphoadenosine phosphosulfate reductase
MELTDHINNIKKTLLRLEAEGNKICITSSFQTHSLPLLHICKEALPDIPVLFIDTGFHFPETYQFRDQIVKEWSLNLKNIRSKVTRLQQRDAQGQFLYTTNPEYCCHINKVEPLDEEIIKYDIWVAGLRRDQTSFRKGLSEFKKQKNGVTKYHPILEWNSKMIYQYRMDHKLPHHPLEEKGYFSIGCLPCTSSATEAGERGGRWLGSNKTECGLHTK